MRPQVPIHAAMIQRVHTEGEAAVDDILKEVRSLSRLSHPNIVHYKSSWIEWTNDGLDSASSNLDVSKDAVLGAAPSGSFAMGSLQRIRTETDTDAHIGISFESRSREATGNAHSNDYPLAIVDGHANDSHVTTTDSVSASENGRQLSVPGPTLNLYLQMAVYPMTLADFIMPKKMPGSCDIQPLAHCFHLEPSIRILLAILEGVEYLHAQNVVHRDLKPANVFLKHEENPKLNPSCVDLSSCADCQAQMATEQPINLGVCIGDFGLVTNIGQAGDVAVGPKSAVGTEIYRPATSKDNVGPRLDVFAVGIIACELLCKFDTQMERRHTLHELKHGRFPKHFGSCAGRHSSRLRDCVASMLSEDPDGGTVRDLKQTLLSMLVTKETVGEVGGREEVMRRSST